MNPTNDKPSTISTDEERRLKVKAAYMVMIRAYLRHKVQKLPTEVKNV